MVSRGETFGRWPGDESEAPTVGSVPLRDLGELTKKEGAHQSPSVLASWSRTSDFRMVRNALLPLVTAQSVKLWYSSFNGLIQATGSKLCLAEVGREYCSEKWMSLLHHPEAGKELGSQVQKGFLVLNGTRMVPPWAHECDSEVYIQHSHHHLKAAECLSQAHGRPAARSESRGTPFPRGVPQVFIMISAMRTNGGLPAPHLELPRSQTLLGIWALTETWGPEM